MVIAPGRDDTRPAQPRVLRLNKIVPKRLPVEIEGYPHPLYGWVTSGDGYPVEVAAALEDAREDYFSRRERVWDGDPPPYLVDTARELVKSAEAGESLERLTELIAEVKKSLRRFDEEPRWRDRSVDWEMFLTRVLCTLVPGLDEETASLMPRDVRTAWLWELGYFKVPPKADADPPETGPSSTGAEHGPNSPGSTA